MSTRPDFSACLDPRAFVRLAAVLARDPGADLFLSGAGLAGETLGLAGVRPVSELIVGPRTRTHELKEFCFSGPGPALGFLGYPFGLGLRGLAGFKTSLFPLGHLKKYAAILRHERGAHRLDLFCADPILRREIVDLLGVGPGPGPEPGLEPVHDPGGPAARPEALQQSLSREGYIRGVERVLERIRDGDVYQLNLSIRFSAARPDLDPADLFFHLLSANPARFYALFSSGPRRLVSTSPERFLRVADGRVLSQPIKGTLRFDPAEGPTRARVRELLASAKEDAELSMIVDLVRNDISNNCEYGSVRVDGHKSVFAVDNLLQMYSNVRGRLRPDRTCLDLLPDAFPGGSVTGCPKGRALELIEDLEPHCRDFYCGCFVMIMDERNMDSSVAIRTACHDADTGELCFYAGSGIVVDSDPDREYRETLAKAEKFLELTRT